jgi:hypothetical protein
MELTGGCPLRKNMRGTIETSGRLDGGCGLKEKDQLGSDESAVMSTRRGWLGQDRYGRGRRVLGLYRYREGSRSSGLSKGKTMSLVSSGRLGDTPMATIPHKITLGRTP